MVQESKQNFWGDRPAVSPTFSFWLVDYSGKIFNSMGTPTKHIIIINGDFPQSICCIKINIYQHLLRDITFFVQHSLPRRGFQLEKRISKHIIMFFELFSSLLDQVVSPTNPNDVGWEGLDVFACICSNLHGMNLIEFMDGFAHEAWSRARSRSPALMLHRQDPAPVCFGQGTGCETDWILQVFRHWPS